MGEPSEVVGAVVKALVATHPHHGYLVGRKTGDDLTPLWLAGKGEFADHRWLIAPDGEVRDEQGVRLTGELGL